MAVWKLREERQRRGWSLMAVGMRTGIAPGDLSALERGLRPAYPGWRRRIAHAFNLPEAALFAPIEPGDVDVEVEG